MFTYEYELGFHPRHSIMDASKIANPPASGKLPRDLESRTVSRLMALVREQEIVLAVFNRVKRPSQSY